MHQNGAPPNPNQLALRFDIGHHDQLPDVSVLRFEFGPMVTIVCWPTAELRNIVDALEKAGASRIVVPKLVPVPRG